MDMRAIHKSIGCIWIYPKRCCHNRPHPRADLPVESSHLERLHPYLRTIRLLQLYEIEHAGRTSAFSGSQ